MNASQSMECLKGDDWIKDSSRSKEGMSDGQERNSSMKRILCIGLMMLISMLGCSAASAQGPGALELSQVHDYETINSLCFIDDTLYMLGTYGVYAFEEDELMTVLDLSPAYSVRYNQQPPDDEEAAALWEQAIAYLFTDGEALYGLHPYSGRIFKIDQGKLVPCGQVPKELIYVQEEEFFREILGTAFADGKLFLLLGTDNWEEYDKTELVSFDLQSQSGKSCSPVGIKGISAGAEGKLLALIGGEENAIWQYDAATDALESKLAAFDGDEGILGGMAWFAQAPVYCSSGRVVSAGGAGQSSVKAYLPVEYSFARSPAACSAAGVYAYPYANYVFLRDIDIDGEPSQTVLTLMGSVPSDIAIAYSIERPDVAIVSAQSLNPNELKQAAISGDTSIDLFLLQAPGMFAAMREKGYIASLSGSENLVSDAKTMYPGIQEVIFDGDRLLGYPIFFEPRSWAVNQTKWEEMGLGEYPATYDELFEKIAVWLEDYAEEYPDYALSDIQQMGLQNVVFMMVEAYIEQNEKNGERLTFDTPAFRAMLRSVSEHADLLAEENDQYGMPLLFSYSIGFGAAYTDTDLTRMILAPTVEAGNPQTLSARMQVLCVNAASKRQGEAAQFIAYCAEKLPDSTRYEIHPDLNEPIERENYAKRLAQLQEELAALKERLDSADEEKRDEIEASIVQKETMIERASENKWDISPESIDIYRTVARDLHVPYQSFLLVSGEGGGYEALYSVVSQHCEQGLSEGEIEALIKDLDRISGMIDLEGR